MRIIRLAEVKTATGLGRSSIYKFISEGTFPKPVSLGTRAVGWIEAEIDAWIESKVAQRGGKES